MLYGHPELDLNPSKKNSFLTGRNLKAHVGGALLGGAVQVTRGTEREIGLEMHRKVEI